MTRLQHVNVVVPKGGTDPVLAFYRDVIGLRPIAKPDGLSPGGAWLEIDDRTQLHLSERDGAGHPETHFALVLDDFGAVVGRLERFEPADEIFGGRRGFTRDPAGNRLELLERAGTLA